MHSTIWGITCTYFAKLGCNQWCVIFFVPLTALRTKQTPSSKHLATVQCFAGKPFGLSSFVDFNLTRSTHTNIAQFLLRWHSQPTTKYHKCQSGPLISLNPHSTDHLQRSSVCMRWASKTRQEVTAQHIVNLYYQCSCIDLHSAHSWGWDTIFSQAVTKTQGHDGLWPSHLQGFRTGPRNIRKERREDAVMFQTEQQQASIIRSSLLPCSKAGASSNWWLWF